MMRLVAQPELSGLTSAEAVDRLARYGPNDPAPPEHRNRLRVLLLFVSNPLVVILLIAAGASIALGDRINGGIIIALVVFSVALDSVQNIRSQAAVKRLQTEIAPKARLLRDGEWKMVAR